MITYQHFHFVEVLGLAVAVLDLFGEDTSFRENGQSSFNTTFGGLISMVIFFLVFMYAGLKFMNVMERSDTKYV